MIRGHELYTDLYMRSISLGATERPGAETVGLINDARAFLNDVAMLEKVLASWT